VVFFSSLLIVRFADSAALIAPPAAMRCGKVAEQFRSLCHVMRVESADPALVRTDPHVGFGRPLEPDVLAQDIALESIPLDADSTASL